MVMDEEQLDRHMASRRGALNKTSVRKVRSALSRGFMFIRGHKLTSTLLHHHILRLPQLVNHVLSQSVSQHVAMVVSGVAKIFVGEIIEKGKQTRMHRTSFLSPLLLTFTSSFA